MSIVVKINDVDRTNVINFDGFSWNSALTSQVDTLTFTTKKFGSRVYSPNAFDEVEIFLNDEKVFGGNILSVDQVTQGVDGLVHLVTVKDYSHIMDRRLVIEQYENKPLINIINEIRNRYLNKIDRIEIAAFSETEIWVGGSVDTVNYRIGNQAMKVTSTNNVESQMDRLIYLNLQPEGFSTDDFIEIECFVDNINNLENATLILSSLSDFSTDYFEKDITSQLVSTGWNLVKVDKTDFTEDGTPDWEMIYGMRLKVTSVAATSVSVTFDNYQVLKPDTFSRDNSLSATQTINFMGFNYETPSKCFQRMAELFAWNWYVDQFKDIHFFAKFDTSSPFNLSDTNGSYIYSSLNFNQNADQLRNSIFVRGADYLGDQEDEDLSHQADGENAIFKLGYKYKNPRLYQNGIEKAVGVDNLDQYEDNQGAAQFLDGSTPVSFGDDASRAYQSQEVIVTKSGRRSGISIKIGKVGAPADNVRVAIYSDSSDKPSATILSGTVNIAGASLTTDLDEVEIVLTEAFTNSLLFEPEDKYHIRITRSGSIDAVNYYIIDVSDVAEYDGYHNQGTSGLVWTRQDTTWYFVERINYEILHSFQEKILTFKNAPLGTDELLFTGDPYLPVFVLYRDNNSIKEFGEYQFKIIDRTIKTKAGAKQRAQQEIIAWANEVNEASFRTYSDGLVVGQTINIQSDIRGLNQDYIIQKITAQPHTKTTFIYNVQCITTRTFGILYWLQQQIAKDDRDEVIDDNETQEKIEIITDEFGFETEYDIDKYTGKVWGDFSPELNLVWDGGAEHIWI